MSAELHTKVVTHFEIEFLFLKRPVDITLTRRDIAIEITENRLAILKSSNKFTLPELKALDQRIFEDVSNQLRAMDLREIEMIHRAKPPTFRARLRKVLKKIQAGFYF